MNPMKRVGTAVLVLVLGGLLAASPALAGGRGGLKQPRVCKLMPPEIDPPEPRASGTCIRDAPLPPVPITEVTVKSTKLTPGKQYFVCWFGHSTWATGCYSVTADGRGTLSVQFIVDEYVHVWVENEHGATVLVEEGY